MVNFGTSGHPFCKMETPYGFVITNSPLAGFLLNEFTSILMMDSLFVDETNLTGPPYFANKDVAQKNKVKAAACLNKFLIILLKFNVVNRNPKCNHKFNDFEYQSPVLTRKV